MHGTVKCVLVFLDFDFRYCPVFQKLPNRDITGNKSAHRTQVIAYCVSQKAYKEGDDLPSQVLKVNGSSEDPPVMYMSSGMRARDAGLLVGLYIIIIIIAIVVVVVVFVAFIFNLWGTNPT